MTNRLQYRIAGQPVEVYSDFPERVSKMLLGFDNFIATYDSDVPLMQFFIESENKDIKESSNEGESVIIHTFNLEESNCKLYRQGNKLIFKIVENDGVLHLKLSMEIGSPIVRCTLIPNPNYLKFSLWIALGFSGIPKDLSAAIAQRISNGPVSCNAPTASTGCISDVVRKVPAAVKSERGRRR